MLTVEHQTARKNNCAELLQHSEKDGDVYVRNNNQWWKPRTSLPPTDERTIDGIIFSVVATKENIQDADY